MEADPKAFGEGETMTASRTRAYPFVFPRLPHSYLPFLALLTPLGVSPEDP